MSNYDDGFITACENYDIGYIMLACRANSTGFLYIQQGVDVAVRNNDYNMLKVVIFFPVEQLTHKLLKYMFDKQYLTHLKKLIKISTNTQIASMLHYIITINEVNMIKFFTEYFINKKHKKIRNIVCDIFSRKTHIFIERRSNIISKQNSKILRRAILLLHYDTNITDHYYFKICIDNWIDNLPGDKIPKGLYKLVFTYRYVATHKKINPFLIKIRQEITRIGNEFLINDVSKIIADYVI